jgi:LysM repeat protein
VKKLMLMAAVAAMVLAAAAPVVAQNVASVQSTQVLQQVGGDQFATATGSGEGDVAAANNQEFNATQVQQSAAIAGTGNAAAQNVGDGGAKATAGVPSGSHHHPSSGDDNGGSATNVATVEATQVLQQVGGDQYANATGTGGGDTAAANNQEFNATQVQQALAIAGEGNAAAQNANVEPAAADNDTAPLIDQSESNGGVVVVQPGDTLTVIAAEVGTTVEALVALNDIENPDLIFPGQVLAF